MIKYLTKKTETLEELPSLEHACWVCILPDFTGKDLLEWAHLFKVPSNYLTDALDMEKFPRYEIQEDTTFLLLRTPVVMEAENDEAAIYKTAPIVVIMKPTFIITACAYDSPVLKKFLDNEVENFDLTDKSQFLLQLMEQNVQYYLECLKFLDSRRDKIESELFHSSQTEELQRLLGIDKSLIYFVNSLSANGNLKEKIWKNNLLDIQKERSMNLRFEDIRLDNAQALETATMYSNILNGIMDTYGTIISTNLNVTIGRLTIITIVLMVPTLIASFYGMNVHLPLEKNPHAFLVLVGLAIVLSFALVWYFLRRRMF